MALAIAGTVGLDDGLGAEQYGVQRLERSMLWLCRVGHALPKIRRQPDAGEEAESPERGMQPFVMVRREAGPLPIGELGKRLRKVTVGLTTTLPSSMAVLQLGKGTQKLNKECRSNGVVPASQNTVAFATTPGRLRLPLLYRLKRCSTHFTLTVEGSWSRSLYLNFPSLISRICLCERPNKTNISFPARFV